MDQLIQARNELGQSMQAGPDVCGVADCACLSPRIQYEMRTWYHRLVTRSDLLCRCASALCMSCLTDFLSPFCTVARAIVLTLFTVNLNDQSHLTMLHVLSHLATQCSFTGEEHTDVQIAEDSRWSSYLCAGVVCLRLGHSSHWYVPSFSFSLSVKER
jgi:hypothetical protein